MGPFLWAVARSALGTILSRITGLVRDAAVAYVFGASASYDAFLVALFIPNALRQLLGEGGLAAAFLPVYARAKEHGEGDALARSTFALLFVILPPLCLVGALLARWYVPILAAGFPPEKMAQAVNLAQWLFPLIGFVSVAALSGGILNAHGRFFLPALAPAALNLSMVVGAVFLSRWLRPPIFGLAAGALVGGVGMVAIQLPFLRGQILGRWPVWPPHPDLGDVGRRLLPVLGGLMVAEVNTLVDNRLASYLADGSIAVLQYAMRLFQFPLGVVAASVAAVALPRLAQHVARGEEQGFRTALARGFLVTAACMLPAMAGLLVLGRPILAMLFQRGAYTAADTLRTYGALAGYLAGLWAYALMYLFSRAFFALGRPALPVLAGAVALALNVGLNLWWVRIWGTFGLALATGIAGWADALLLGIILWRRHPGWVQWRPVLAVGLASAGMGLGVAVADRFLVPYGPWVEVAVGTMLGVVLYLGLAWLLGLPRWLRAAR
ncbi:MAG: murein biosynthesis integral membrane protein MurJ [Candidatus Acetothermia bacterium]|jgi:putative peptidoglycan lipid II flippase|nr:murein biosynthesis integral membrane protein MurJ [Candidatus Acetothermia bacterium]